MHLLSVVGIAELAQEPAAKLSYGQKKLLELAACLMTEPRLVLLDEPAGGINPALIEISSIASASCAPSVSRS